MFFIGIFLFLIVWKENENKNIVDSLPLSPVGFPSLTLVMSLLVVTVYPSTQFVKTIFD